MTASPAASSLAVRLRIKAKYFRLLQHLKSNAQHDLSLSLRECLIEGLIVSFSESLTTRNRLTFLLLLN